MVVQIIITSSEETTGHTTYTLQVQENTKEWVVVKRYSEFVQLDDALPAVVSRKPLPEKGLMGIRKAVNFRGFKQKRLNGLQDYLSDLAARLQSLSQLPALASWLQSTQVCILHPLANDTADPPVQAALGSSDGLYHSLASTDANVRLSAVKRLSRLADIGDHRAAKAVVKSLRDQDSNVRIAAIRAIVTMKSLKPSNKIVVISELLQSEPLDPVLHAGKDAINILAKQVAEADDKPVTRTSAEISAAEEEKVAKIFGQISREVHALKRRYSKTLEAMTERSASAEYQKLLTFTNKVIEVAQRGNGFVCSRGLYGYHVLFDETEMLPYFNMIRDSIAQGQAGSCLMKALASGAISADSCNRHIWNALIQSLSFSGIDFEHRYDILPSTDGDAETSASVWDYSFAESIVLGHTLLLAPVMQHYGPLMPKLDLSGPTKRFDAALPLLAVGMIGDCVKGSFFNEIKQKAEEGDTAAQQQKGILLNAERLQQKMRGLVRALLTAKQECGASGLLFDSVLVGAGAFGGSTKALAQPFADSLNGGDLPFDDTKDEVNFYMFPPPKPDELTLETLKYKVSLNSKRGLGGIPPAADDRVRILVAGFDPISIAPHGVLNRAFSAEGQLCHSTDFLYRITTSPGTFVHVHVPKGPAWESPAAFFAKPQEPKYKEEEAYETVRFVPESVLEALGVEEGQDQHIQLEAHARVPPRVWNGDAFDGWTLSLGSSLGQTWKEALRSREVNSEKCETTEYRKLLVFTNKVIEIAQRRSGFVFARGLYGFHILFDESQMLPFFDMIRSSLAEGRAGSCLTRALAVGAISVDSCNKHIWNALMQSLSFSGIDFEHRYDILPSSGAEAETSRGVWDYSFAESIVLGHTLLLVPVMQHYGPLTPKLDLHGPTKKFEVAQPLLAVGMIGDCLKGSFFNEIKQKAEEGDTTAQMQKDTLLNPERLQQKMSSLVRTLLLARQECGAPGLHLDATLVGSGAFGGSTKALAQPFADSLNGGVPLDNSRDEVNFYMFPPPKPDELTLESLKYKVSLNSKKGLGGILPAADDRVRILVAGFDPISLAPHGVLNRAFSAEGQLCHSTDFLYRTTCMAGKFTRIHVPSGPAWESPAAFFAKPQEPKYKEEEAYDTVRFVPESVLQDLGVEEGRELDVRLEANARVPPRVWNGDAFDGWTLSYGHNTGQTWHEALHCRELLSNF